MAAVTLGGRTTVACGAATTAAGLAGAGAVAGGGKGAPPFGRAELYLACGTAPDGLAAGGDGLRVPAG